MTKTAESAVEALETLPFGEPWRATFDAAAAAIATEHAAADLQVFPLAIEPTTADAIAEYTWHTLRLGAVGYGQALAALHERAHGGLRALLRSREAMEDVGAAAARHAAPASNQETHAAAEQRAAHLAIQAYKAAIARQLDTPAARRLVELEALSARVDAARQRHEAHATAEIDRVEAERRAAARVVADRTVELVRSAEARLADARQAATATEIEYRQALATAFVAKLQASGRKQLRVGEGGALYGTDDLAATAHRMSLEQIRMFLAALDGDRA